MLRRSIVGGLAAVLISIAAMGGQGALAHSRPVSFSPAPGAVLEAAPAKVEGWFTSDIKRADESFIRVMDANGARVDAGQTSLSPDRRQMGVGLAGGLGPGRYLVHWSTHDDADGEVFAGCHVFFVGQAAADAAVSGGMALDGGADCPAAGHAEGTTAASIEISIPAVVDGSAATLTIMPSGFTPRAPTGSGRDPLFGHYHVYLDKVPLDVLGDDHEDEEASHEDEMAETPMAGHDVDTDDSSREGGLVENPAMWFEDEFKFTNLSPGRHTVSVAVFYDDHTPFSPPVVASKTFSVETDGDDGVPLWGLIVGVAAAVVVGGIGGRLLGARA